MSDTTQPRLPPITIQPQLPLKQDVDITESAAPSPAAEESQKRPREGGSSSSRGVANLTPSQLAKKRANDREAQRAIRTRTKNQIENLERRIRELTNQQPYMELAGVVAERDALREELRSVRERVKGAMDVLGGVTGGQAQQQSYISGRERERPGSRDNWNANASTPSSGTAGVSPGGAAWQGPGDSRFPPSVRQAPYSYDMVPERLGLDYVLDGSQRSGKPPTGNMQEQSSYPLPRLSERGSPIHHIGTPTTYNHEGQNQGPTLSTLNLNLDIPFHSIPVRNTPPSCPLDSLLLDFLHQKQALISSGTPTSAAIGPSHPSFSVLLPLNHPASTPSLHPPQNRTNSLTTLFSSILTTFPTLSPLPEKLAINYMMFIYMRWSIAPSAQTYDDLPSCLVPRVSQISTPHPAWIDYLPHPAMRDRLVRMFAQGRETVVAFDDFFVPYTRTVAVCGWEGECLVQEGGEWRLSPEFQDYFTREENWSVGSEFAQAFPALEGTIKIRDLR